MFLYIRMVVIMLVQLYTSRVILQTLGVEDYGIYNIVGAVVISLSFITGPLSTATQRFLSFELGKKNTGRIKDIFSMSLIVYGILSIILLIVAETVGLWFLNHKMDIPADRLYAANWVFQCSIITFIINILNTPFNSAIIAYEKMSFYAYISIFEAIAKLAIVYFLLLYTQDKLILYSILIVIITILITTIYKIYCNKYLPEIKFHITKNIKLLKQLLSFSGWSLFGSMANMSADQGINMLLNLFFGVTVNAAMGIANQVSSAINQFVGNFQTAFRPQIVKSYAERNTDYLHFLIYKSCKFSILLLYTIILPIFLNLNIILYYWLGENVPIYTERFCKLILISSLIDSLSSPLWITIHATGRIKKYQLGISSLMFCNIILSYIFLRQGYPPETVLKIKCILTVFYFIFRFYIVHRQINLSVKQFYRSVLYPISIPIGTTILLSVINHYFPIIPNTMYTIIIFSFYLYMVWLCGIEKEEKRYILKCLNK